MEVKSDLSSIFSISSERKSVSGFPPGKDPWAEAAIEQNARIAVSPHFANMTIMNLIVIINLQYSQEYKQDAGKIVQPAISGIAG